MIELGENLKEVDSQTIGTAIKVKVKEEITGNKNTKWFTFTEKQLQNDRYKRHLEEWKENLTN